MEIPCMERTRLVLIISTSSGTTKQGVQLRVLAFQFLRQHRISRISTCTSRVAPRIANSPLPVGVANGKAAAEELQVVARTRGSRDPRCTPRCVRAAINERRRCQLPQTVVPGAVPKARAVRRDLDGTGLLTKASMRVREIFACHFSLLLKRWCGYNGPSPF